MAGMPKSVPYPQQRPSSPFSQPQGGGMPTQQQPPYGQWYNHLIRPFGGQQQSPVQAPPAAPTFGNVAASIQPQQQQVFSSAMTNTAANQAQANADRFASLPAMLKQYDRPGVSRSPGTIAMAMPQMAEVRGQGAEAAAGIRAGDQLANRQMQLAGQQAQDAEGQGLASLLRRLWNMDQANQMNDFNLGLNMIGRLM